MGKFDGKKLLELGTSVGSVDIVQYAKSEGAYVIVTDYLPPEKSEAKRYADETAMISTLDVDALIAFAREKKIDAVFCGVSEDNLLSVRAVAEALNLPCYFTKEQWEITGNKIEFKRMCREYGIPVVKEYEISDQLSKEELEQIEYPVIMKPADSSASKGTTFCENETELIKEYHHVKKFSQTGRVIVEKYIVGTEIVAYFTVCNGEMTLSSVSDRYNAENMTGLNCLPEAYQYPSKYTKIFINKYEKRFKNMMLNGMGLKNGVFGVQGFACNGDLVFFEMGLRLGGTSQYRYTSALHHIRNVEMMVSYALNGRMEGYPLSLDNPLFEKPCCTLTLRARPGKIKSMVGVEEVNQMPGVIYNEVHYNVGDNVIASGTLKELVFWVFIVGETVDEVKRTIRNVKSALKVLDENGENMIISNFDENRLDYTYRN